MPFIRKRRRPLEPFDGLAADRQSSGGGRRVSGANGRSRRSSAWNEAVHDEDRLTPLPGDDAPSGETPAVPHRSTSNTIGCADHPPAEIGVQGMRLAAGDRALRRDQRLRQYLAAKTRFQPLFGEWPTNRSSLVGSRSNSATSSSAVMSSAPRCVDDLFVGDGARQCGCRECHPPPIEGYPSATNEIQPAQSTASRPAQKPGKAKQGERNNQRDKRVRQVNVREPASNPGTKPGRLPAGTSP